MQCIQVRDSPLPVEHNHDDEYQEQQIFTSDARSNCNSANIGATVTVEDGYSHGDYAVFIRNVHKRYEYGPPILRNFSMTVKQGSIYGLLGSSGCGKTTILSCIVGLQKCDSGDLLVFGMEPGTKGSGIPGKSLGYMPQEIALYNHLSIREVIQFYGRVYGMKSREITEQWDFLNTLLKLPPSSKLIGDLSGGQQRRVSLALALIHSPALLILDEPTVGLDPLLRIDIWEYLYQIVRKLGTTIIITTHYIEEARKSDTIGIMRNGHLIVENTPSNLLRYYNCDLLEQVVLQLCRTTNSNSFDNSPPYEQHGNKMLKSSTNETSSSTYFRPIRHDGETSETFTSTVTKSDAVNRISATNIQNNRIIHLLSRIYGFTIVLLMTFVRNPAYLLFTLFIPCIEGTLTLLCVGSKPGGMHLGIVNPELTNWTVECASDIHLDDSCDLSALSCKYINHLKRDDILVLRPFESELDALSQTHLGSISGYLVFPENYSEHSLELFTEKHFTPRESIDGSRIHVHLDYSQRIQVLLTIKHLFMSYLLYVKDLASSCKIGSQQADLPLLYRTPVFGMEDDYTTYIIPGLFLVSFIGIGFAMAGMMIISDRKQGTLSRAHVAGLTIGDVFSGHLIVQSIIAIGQIVIWNIILHFGFRFQSIGSSWLIVLISLLTQWCGSAIGIFMAQIFMEEMYVLCMAIFLFLVFIQFTSTLFPKELMSNFWRKAAYVVPTTIPTEALRSIMIRGIGITDPFVWSGMLILIAWIVGLLFVSVLIYKKCNR